MDLKVSSSDSKLHLPITKREMRSVSAVSLPKSENNMSVTQSSSNDQLKQFRSWVSNDRWNQLRKTAEAAMSSHKVFMIKGGGFPAVRRALVERGWVEKYEVHKIRNPPTNFDPKKVTGKEMTKVERMIIYKFLEGYSVDFLWTTKRDRYDWLLSNKEVIISRFCRSIFTTKEGLTASITQMHWFTEPGLSVTRFPRCYNITQSESLEEFISDFRLTACISLIKWIATLPKKKKTEDVPVDYLGKVPFSAVEFAISRINEFVDFTSHKDLDMPEDHYVHIWEHEWDQFLTYHYLIVHENAYFTEDKNITFKQVEKKATKTLARIKKYWPQIDIDGVHNIWIVKPGNKCRGRGIQLMNNLKDIVSLVNVPTAQKSRFVVQKYIETPLVVYNTKFDIRQWFLITNCQPLTIWVYKDSYLRFSSQIFSLSNYHESVHLTNNAVQNRYKNHNERSKALPDENMWDCHTFKTYLRQIGQADIWDTKIYPGMKQCLIGAMLACQDAMDKRQNSFEVYGADFMLSDDFTPWLIEINSSPDMAPTTSVTARLCPQCLEDCIKVVLDKKYNFDADTGTFELVYRQTIPKPPAYFGLSLCVTGRKMIKRLRERKGEGKSGTISQDIQPVDSIKDTDQIIPPEYSGPIITDFLSWLNPYDHLPTDKDGIVLGPTTMTVRPAITEVKSNVSLSKSSKKRKYSAPNFRSTLHKDRNRRKRKEECKRRVVHHSCCQNKEPLLTEKYQNESFKVSKKDIDKSVGNKRCYIDPDVWERQAASILDKQVQKNVNNVVDNQLGRYRLCRSSNVEKLKGNELKKLKAIGTSIPRVSRSVEKQLKFSKCCTAYYGSYRVVVGPLNDVHDK